MTKFSLSTHMFDGLRRRLQKTGQPPGTPVYTGEEQAVNPAIDVIAYDDKNFQAVHGSNLAQCTAVLDLPSKQWLNITGLRDIALIGQIAERYNLHPLTVEDILNVQQSAKVEEFPNYIFIVLKLILWNKEKQNYSVEQISIVIGKDFLLSFQERDYSLFDTIRSRLGDNPTQRLRQQSSDYLGYRLIDSVIDQYFVVLEGIGDEIEALEELIILTPTPENSRGIYRLKRQVLLLRKLIWPIREAISHLLQTDDKLISAFTHVYIRDIYDHVAQTIDTIETFRDMLSSILDVYLSSLSNRMNEVMKVLTMIATIFIPITFITSVFGMNFKFMPILNWKWGFPICLLAMTAIVIVMVCYFRRKKWL